MNTTRTQTAPPTNVSRWSFRQLKPSEYPKHEELVRRSPQGSLWALKAWTDYNSCDSEVWGAFKGSELVGSVNVPVLNGAVLRYLPGTPWTGVVARRSIEEAEGECLEIAGGLARCLRARHDEVTLTLSPEWFDIRGFLWNGFFPHVRYTYRSDRASLAYEKRVSLKDPAVGSPQDSTRISPIAPGVVRVQREFGGSDATLLSDWRHVYYWKSNEGGSHAGLVDAAIRDASGRDLGFDLVGANSPRRGLFKRAFGQGLRSYFAVSTVSPGIDLRA